MYTSSSSKYSFAIFLPILLVLIFSLIAFLDNKKNHTPSSHSLVSALGSDKPVAEVFGKTLYLSDIDRLPIGNSPPYVQLPPKQKRMALTSVLIQHEILYHAALKDHFTFTRRWRNTRKNSLRMLLPQEYITYLSETAVPMEQVRKFYDEQLGNMPTGKKQYHVAHILLKTKAQAQRILTKINAGQSFEKLARTQTQDKASASTNGDLGWMSPENLVKPFQDVMVRMKPGETSKKPIKTPFGWHILHLIAVRDAKPPAFDTLKERLQKELSQQKIMTTFRNLQKEAHVKFYDEQGKLLKTPKPTPKNAGKKPVQAK